MLTLNPNDNQGIRDLLLSGLIRRNDEPGAKALLAIYPEEWSVTRLYTRALIAFRAILAGTKRPSADRSGDVPVGGPDETAEYAREFGEVWKDTRAPSHG